MRPQDSVSGSGVWRRLAEERVAAKAGESSGDPLEAAEMARMLHELMVHEVELEMQNEELIEARHELEASSEQLADLYDHAPVGYFSLSGTGVIRRLNRLGAEMLGGEREGLLGRKVGEFVSLRKRATLDRFLADVFSGESPEPCEVVLIRPGREPLTVTLTGSLSPNGLNCQLVAMDVTEQRRVEAEVKERNEDLDRLFNLSHDLLAIMGNDGRYKRVNPAFERLLGHSVKELTGGDFLHFVHPDDREAASRMMVRLRAGREVLDVVNRYRCVDGSYRWLEWRATPYGDNLICSLARDVTSRKQAEDAVRRSEEKFRSVIECSPTAMHLYQLGEDGRLILIGANPAADEELGINHRDLIGKSLVEAFPKLAETRIPEMYLAVAKGQLGSQHFEMDYEGGGISGCYEVHVFQTNPGSIAVAFSDITERRAARVSIEKNQLELEERVRVRTTELQDRTLQLRALADELTNAEERERRRIAGLIHEDLQQMLVAALLNFQMLKSRLSNVDEAEELARIEEILRDSIKTARSLTAELSPPVLQQDGLAAALEWLRNWCGEKYSMVVDVELEACAEPGPEARVCLFHCVRELLFNTVKHAGVKAAKLRMWATSGGLLKIEVSDSGRGFDPNEVRAREGTVGGFGLFSIRERLERLGGGLEIESSPGAGCRFTLWVPLGEAAEAE